MPTRGARSPAAPSSARAAQRWNVSAALQSVLREAGLAFEPVLASTKTHKLQDGTDYYTINPKGYVPVLELDNGERLAELGGGVTADLLA